MRSAPSASACRAFITVSIFVFFFESGYYNACVPAEGDIIYDATYARIRSRVVYDLNIAIKRIMTIINEKGHIVCAQSNGFFLLLLFSPPRYA